jgi:hypothetical protein
LSSAEIVELTEASLALASCKPRHLSKNHAPSYKRNVPAWLWQQQQQQQAQRQARQVRQARLSWLVSITNLSAYGEERQVESVLTFAGVSKMSSSSSSSSSTAMGEPTVKGIVCWVFAV